MFQLSSILFPKYCLGCYRFGSYLCNECENRLFKIDIQECIICSKYSNNGLTHRICQSKYSPKQLLASYEYKTLIKHYISEAKNNGALKCLDPLVKSITTNRIFDYLDISHSIDLVIPIPSTERLFDARFENHSAHIANLIGAKYNIKILDIFQKNSTTKQKTLTREKRINQTKGIILKSDYISIIMEKRILLVDDVITTGATFCEATRLLMEHNAKEVSCYSLSKDLMYNIVN